MNKILEKYSNLSITSLILFTIALLLILVLKTVGVSSDAFLSLISAIIGGLIASSSQAWVSAQDRKNQLRLAALDRRLEAHQHAYYLWRKLMFTIETTTNFEKLKPITKEGEVWWEKNCLYLDPIAREHFYNALQNAHLLRVLGEGRDESNIKNNIQEIKIAGKFIVKGVLLPTIGEEYEFIHNQK